MRCAADVSYSPGAKRRSDTSLRQARKPVAIQALIPKANVEALDECVLCGLVGLDRLELGAMLAGPRIECLAGKLWPLASSNGLRVAPEPGCLIEDARHLMA